MKEVIIRIPEDSLNASISMVSDSITKKKTIAIEDLIASLVSDYKLSTGLLPFGTRHFTGGANNYSIAIELISKVRDMTLLKYNASGTKKVDEIIQIAYPTCLFYFIIKNNRITKTNLFALKHPLQTDNDSLYSFPFSNVYHEGNICWGQVSLPLITKPMELVGVINLFLSSQFNGDLSGGNFRSIDGKDRYDFWSVVDYLKGKEEYPVDTLVSAGIKFKSLYKSSNKNDDDEY